MIFCKIQSPIVGCGLQLGLVSVLIIIHEQPPAQSPQTKLQWSSQSDNVSHEPTEPTGCTAFDIHP